MYTPKVIVSDSLDKLTFPTHWLNSKIKLTQSFPGIQYTAYSSENVIFNYMVCDGPTCIGKETFTFVGGGGLQNARK